MRKRYVVFLSTAACSVGWERQACDQEWYTSRAAAFARAADLQTLWINGCCTVVEVGV